MAKPAKSIFHERRGRKRDFLPIRHEKSILFLFSVFVLFLFLFLIPLRSSRPDRVPRSPLDRPLVLHRPLVLPPLPLLLSQHDPPEGRHRRQTIP